MQVNLSIHTRIPNNKFTSFLSLWIFELVKLWKFATRMFLASKRQYFNPAGTHHVRFGSVLDTHRSKHPMSYWWKNTFLTFQLKIYSAKNAHSDRRQRSACGFMSSIASRYAKLVATSNKIIHFIYTCRLRSINSSYASYYTGLYSPPARVSHACSQFTVPTSKFAYRKKLPLIITRDKFFEIKFSTAVSSVVHTTSPLFANSGRCFWTRPWHNGLVSLWAFKWKL